VKNLVKRIIYFIILILLGVSCRKASYANEDYILIGDPTNMIVKNYDSSLYNYQTSQSINIDVNNDGIQDFALVSGNFEEGLGCSFQDYVAISSLNGGARLYGILRSDTLFLRTFSTIDTLHGPVTVYRQYGYSYIRKTQKDTIADIIKNHFLVSPQNYRNKLYKKDYFQFSEDTLDEYPVQCLAGLTLRRNDTFFMQYPYYYNDCYLFPSNGICYIGFKLVIGTSEKLGWIKYNVTNYNQVLLLESAVEE
jgi:hypothetical protein